MSSNDQILLMLQDISAQNKIISSQNQEILSQNSTINSDIKLLNTKIDDTVLNLTKRITVLEQENLELKGRVQFAERKLRKNNFLIFGYEPTGDSIVNEVISFIDSKLNIKLCFNDFNNAFTIRSNIILVELVSYLKKQQIFSKVSNLKGTGVSFSHDLTPEDQIINKVLIKHLKLAKENKLNAKIKNNALIVNGEKFTWEELENPTHSSSTGSQVNGVNPIPNHFNKKRPLSVPNSPTVFKTPSETTNQTPSAGAKPIRARKLSKQEVADSVADGKSQA